MTQRMAGRLGRLLLRLAPQHLRRSHGREMEWMLAESLQMEVRRRGLLGFLLFCWGVLRDALSFRAAERLERRRLTPKRPLRGTIMNNLLQDFRFGLRTLLKSPAFTLVALLTLALGIGANTALFSLVNGVLLRPLPFEEPERLVQAWEACPEINFPRIPFSPPDYQDFVNMQQSFSQVAAYTGREVELSGRSDPERAMAGRVTASLFPVLGVDAALGRTFTQEEDSPGHQLAILSHPLWQRRFGADPDILGKTILLDRDPYTIIGVMPLGFVFPMAGPSLLQQPADLWIPLAFTPLELGRRGMLYNHVVVARLKPGVTLEQAQNASNLIGERIQQNYPAALNEFLRGGRLQILVGSMHSEVVGLAGPLLLILLAAVGLVLLIGCANIANLLLSRANARRREIAIRSALGAGRWRIFAQLLSEGLLLALCGGALGLLAALGIIPLLLSLSPADLPRTSEISIDGWVMGFTLLIALATALIFSVIPGLGAARTDVQSSLQEGGRGGSGGAERRRLQSLFVVCQMTLALVLLISAGLLLRSFGELLTTDPGFRPAHTFSLNVPLPLSAYPEAQQIRNLYNVLLERTANLPGAALTGASTDLPLSRRETRGFEREGQGAGSQSSPPVVAQSWILGDYLQALGVPLLQGRYFTPEDRLGNPEVVIISHQMADRFWSGENPIGQRIRWAVGSPWMTVVGVVGDVHDGPLAAAPEPHTYTPYLQMPDGALVSPNFEQIRALNLVVQTHSDTAGLIPLVRREMHSLDPQLAVGEVQTLEQTVQDSLAPQRFQTLLLGVFAAVALFLSSVGIYGVISYSVSQRINECGIRMALGASPRELLRLVMGQGLRLVLFSVVLGVAVSLLSTQVLSSLLYGVSATDPITFAAIPALLVLVAVMAILIPARRAMRVDPVEALRCG